MLNELCNSYGFVNPVFYLPELRVIGPESNTSRMARLCWKYGIPPVTFFNKYLKKGEPVNRKFFHREVATQLNSHTEKTLDYEAKINKLVGLSDSRRFSYSYLHDILDVSAHGMISDSKKWCPTCYKERFRPNEMANEIFDDLYWTLEPIKTCLLHGYALRHKCYECFSVQPYISTTVEPGYCHHCLAFLGGGFESFVGDEELSFQRELFTLFYVDTYEEFRPEFNALVNNLKALKQAFPDATSKYLGDAMGVSDDVVKKWISGRRKPRIETLFQLQKVLGLYGPHQLFYKTEMFMNKVLLSKSLSLKFNTRSPFSGMVKDREILAEFQRIFSGEIPTVSRADFAERFDVSEGFLMSRYAGLCHRLSAAHANHLAHLREVKAKELVEQLTIALGKVSSRKKSWTIENAIKELKDPSIISGMQEHELVIPIEKAKLRLKEMRDAASLRKQDRGWIK